MCLAVSLCGLPSAGNIFVWPLPLKSVCMASPPLGVAGVSTHRYVLQEPCGNEHGRKA